MSIYEYVTKTIHYAFILLLLKNLVVMKENFCPARADIFAASHLGFPFFWDIKPRHAVNGFRHFETT